MSERGPETTDAALADRLENLRRVGELVLAADTAEAVALASLETIAERTSVARASVTEIDFERGESTVLAVVREGSGPLPAGARFRFDDEVLIRRYQAGQSLVVEDLRRIDAPSDLERALLAEGLRSVVNLPLLAGGELVGSLNLGAREPDGFVEAELAFARDLANLVAVAIRQARLREQLRQQAIDLQQSLAELQRVDAWRAGLVNMLAHDVRSPLGTVASTLDLLQRPEYGLTEAQRQDFLRDARRSIDRALTLCADLLDQARSEQGRLVVRPERINIARAVRNAVEVIDTAGRTAVDADDEVQGQVDPARFEQIVVNLVGNALKHGVPPVTVGVQADSGGGFTLHVEDRGPGISPDEREDLFAAFSRGARTDSVGLGLWVSSELVRAHGGRIAYEDAEEGGARFVLAFPG